MIAFLLAAVLLFVVGALFMPRKRLAKPWPAMLPALAVVAIPLAAGSLYLALASSPVPELQAAAAPTGQGREFTEAQILRMIAGLEEQLKADPGDIEAWIRLARSHIALGRFDAAARAYGHLAALAPADAGLLADYADTLAMSHNKSLVGEPEKLIALALEANPQNIKALALSGSAAFERRDYQTAVTQWKKILMLVPPESENAKSTLSSIGEAQSLAAELSAASAPAANPAIAPGSQVSRDNKMQ